MGKCPECGQWETFVEKTLSSDSTSGKTARSLSGIQPVAIDTVEMTQETRVTTGIREFDRVLGGGIVAGTLILIGGDPGIGKSTLMLQALHGLAGQGHSVLYVSGEESIRQIKLRSQRLDTLSSNIQVACEIDLEAILATVEEQKPHVLVIDSIQTMYNGDLSSVPGSVTQVRESTMRLMIMAKKTGIPVFLVGHVTKDGAIAGPRIMEHMVDTVLYFEGDRNHVFRILRAVKNRFGSTNEIGVFEMKKRGLEEVSNPSAVFLSERPHNAPGSVVTASMEGTRPILVELQGLASSSSLGTPRRTILGLDQNRVALLVAVMEKKLGLQLMGYDIFMNVAGGVKVIEPAVDLSIIAAIASSFLDRAIADNTVLLGEVGLTGEVRAISHIEARVGEIKKMGFTRCVVPYNSMKRLSKISDINVLGVKNLTEAMEALFE
jgi:DNA repair protein RadA/Sms